MLLRFLLFIVALTLQIGACRGACQSSCYSSVGLYGIETRRRWKRSVFASNSALVRDKLRNGLGVVATEKCVRSFPIKFLLGSSAIILARHWAYSRHLGLNSDQSNDNESRKIENENGREKENDELKDQTQPKIESDIVSASMISSIRVYKEFISPLLPPACRFLPTCSIYGVQAIQEFGPTKGTLLIAWRLARCTPLGGKGYDPPKWPPVPYNYGSW
jgi:uncharacterized protein